MEKEHIFFLQILRDFIREKHTDEPSFEVDWNRITGLARRHNMMGIVYVQCRNILENNPGLALYHKKLRDGFLSEVSCAICRNEDFWQIQEKFQEQGIRFIVMKGKELSRYYPEPLLRTMGDIDIVIREGDRKKSHAVMEELGYVSKQDLSAVWEYFRDLSHIEIHDHMIYEPLANQIDYQSYFDQVWDHVRVRPGTSRCDLEESFHFLYLMAHTAKHIINNGNGFRPFLDMVFLVQKCGGEMDWNWIAAELKKLALLDFTKTCFALCSRWFEVDMPIASGKLDEEFYRRATEKTFQDGIFGFDNEDNKIATPAKTIQRSRLPYWMESLRMIFGRLFPSYEDMRTIPWYSFLDGHPWMLPLAWVYRYGYCLKHKFTQGKQALTEPYVRKKETEERCSYISDWGL